MKKKLSNNQFIRFRRWSRKAYAAFASIGKCVTIGCLRKSVADSSLSKQQNSSAAKCGLESYSGTVKGENKEDGLPPEYEDLLSLITERIKLRETIVEPCFCIQQNSGSTNAFYIIESPKRCMEYGKLFVMNTPIPCTFLFFNHINEEKE